MKSPTKLPNKNITPKFLLYMISRTEFAPDRDGVVIGYYVDTTIILDGTSIKVYSNDGQNFNEFYLSEIIYFDDDL